MRVSASIDSVRLLDEMRRLKRIRLVGRNAEDLTRGTPIVVSRLRDTAALESGGGQPSGEVPTIDRTWSDN